MTTVTVTAAGAGSFTIPAGVTSIEFELWGLGTSGGGTPGSSQGQGGNGGGFYKVTYSVVQGDVIYWDISSNPGSYSWFRKNTNAESGAWRKAAGSTKAAGTDGGTLNLDYNGGLGAAAQGGGGPNRAGSGGGGAAGPDGAGVAGSEGAGTTRGAGGAGSNGSGGAGGTDVSPNGVSNSAGGGGAAGASKDAGAGVPGFPGGGGGGAGSGDAAASGTSGRTGQIRYTYVLASFSPPPIFPGRQYHSFLAR